MAAYQLLGRSDFRRDCGMGNALSGSPWFREPSHSHDSGNTLPIRNGDGRFAHGGVDYPSTLGRQEACRTERCSGHHERRDPRTDGERNLCRFERLCAPLIHGADPHLSGDVDYAIHLRLHAFQRGESMKDLGADSKLEICTLLQDAQTAVFISP